MRPKPTLWLWARTAENPSVEFSAFEAMRLLVDDHIWDEMERLHLIAVEEAKAIRKVTEQGKKVQAQPAAASTIAARGGA